MVPKIVIKSLRTLDAIRLHPKKWDKHCVGFKVRVLEPAFDQTDSIGPIEKAPARETRISWPNWTILEVSCLTILASSITYRQWMATIHGELRLRRNSRASTWRGTSEVSSNVYTLSICSELKTCLSAWSVLRHSKCNKQLWYSHVTPSIISMKNVAKTGLRPRQNVHCVGKTSWRISRSSRKLTPTSPDNQTKKIKTKTIISKKKR